MKIEEGKGLLVARKNVNVKKEGKRQGNANRRDRDEENTTRHDERVGIHSKTERRERGDRDGHDGILRVGGEQERTRTRTLKTRRMGERERVRQEVKSVFEDVEQLRGAS